MIAVSGGVDSMVLLNMLSNLIGVELVVAHYNHGIRANSGEDEDFVAAAAGKLGLPYEAGRGRLGAGASEERARDARYEFLERVRAKHGAAAVITAHHQDDLIETAFINLLRGTGRRGLTAIASNPRILRPLLGYSKKEIVEYALKNNLEWREDPTNRQTDYLRNYLRQKIITKMDMTAREQILHNLNSAIKLDESINGELDAFAGGVMINNEINRSRFSALPVEIGNELLMRWLRELGLRDFDKRMIGRLNTAIRTAKSGTTHPVKKNLNLKISQKTADFMRSPLR